VTIDKGHLAIANNHVAKAKNALLIEKTGLFKQRHGNICNTICMAFLLWQPESWPI
jgi:hypothetical protein